MCLVVLLGLMVPRVVLAALLFLTDWLRVIDPWWLGVLGFVALPYTTLAYVSIHHYSGNVTTDSMAHMVIMLVALLTDVGAWGGSHRYRRGRG